MDTEFKSSKIEVDPRTGFKVGSPEYDNYYFSKIEKDNPLLTEGPFLSYDGKQWPTIKDAKEYNTIFYDKLFTSEKPSYIIQNEDITTPKHL